MVFSIAAFHFFEVSAVGHFCTPILKRKSKCKARRYYHRIVCCGISYFTIAIYNSIATVGHVIIAIIILIWFESRS